MLWSNFREMRPNDSQKFNKCPQNKILIIWRIIWMLGRNFNESTRGFRIPLCLFPFSKREESEANFVGKWTRLEGSLFHYLVWLKIQRQKIQIHRKWKHKKGNTQNNIKTHTKWRVNIITYLVWLKIQWQTNTYQKTDTNKKLQINTKSDTNMVGLWQYHKYQCYCCQYIQSCQMSNVKCQMSDCMSWHVNVKCKK